jgi:Protein of unknown function (DUF3987)
MTLTAQMFAPSAVVTPIRPGRDDWPLPLADCAYDGIVGDIATAIAPHTEADPAALLIQGLVAFGNIIGHGPHCRADGAAHHTNLNAVLVGKTAKGRKGTSWAQIRRPFEAADDTFADRIEFGLSSGEGLIFAVRDPVLKGPAVEDPGIADKRLLVTEGEFAHVVKSLSREGNILSAVIREAWDSGNLGTLTKHARTKATDAHISITGHITKDELRRYLDATEAGNGFGNRFLWVCVKRSKTLPYGGELSSIDFAPLVRQLHQAIVRGRAVDELRHDDSARALWIQVYPELSEGQPGLLGAMTSRAEAQVLRLAALYALTDMSFRSYVVSASHLRSALEMWRYCYDSARYIFDDSLGDSTADAILAALKAADNGLTRTEIRDLFGSNKPAADITRALSMLAEYGKAVRRESRNSNGGRPVECWSAL